MDWYLQTRSSGTDEVMHMRWGRFGMFMRRRLRIPSELIILKHDKSL